MHPSIAPFVHSTSGVGGGVLVVLPSNSIGEMKTMYLLVLCE